MDELRVQVDSARRHGHILRSLLLQDVAQRTFIKRPQRAFLGLEDRRHFLERGLGHGRRIEGELVDEREAGAQRLGLGVQLRRPDAAQKRFGMGDGVLHQFLNGLMDVGLRVDAERLRHLPGGDLGVGRLLHGGVGGVRVRTARHVGRLFEARLQRHQGVHVGLIGSADELHDLARRHHFVRSVEGVLHGLRVDVGVVRRQPEQRQQRRLVAGGLHQLGGRVAQAAVPHDVRVLEVGPPLGDEVRQISVAQVFLHLQPVDDGWGVVAQHPALAAEVLIGLLDGVLHPAEALLGESARHVAIVDDHLGRAGELLVEIDRRVVAIRLGQHELVDPLDARELRQVAAGTINRRRVILRRVRIGDLGDPRNRSPTAFAPARGARDRCRARRATSPS